MLDLKNLEAFVWIARLGGFRAAAGRLNTTQPAISARIAQLEKELGVQLFNRGTRRVTLTLKGMELLDHAERMLTLQAELVHAVAESTTLRGLIRLGVAETIVHTWLSRLIERVHNRFPLVSLEIEVDTSIHLRNGLLAHDLDIAFMLGPVAEPDMRNEALSSYPMAWVASPSLDLPAGRLGLADLARYPVITFSRQTKPSVAIQQMFKRPGLPPLRFYGNSSLASIVRMTLDGIGISAIPPAVIERELAEGLLRLIPAEDPLPDLDFTICHPVDSDNPLVPIVADMALEIVRAQRHRTPTDKRRLSQTIKNENLTDRTDA
ncbi:LysR family transcriptional regulator [Azospirillum brasilense]|uniref:LysR family transcriptional regulator n=1 Tax=Azospirillum brasilense TaxID=192 RepID=UPI001EDBE324|nr:LysR family transcriptional regulator [Azospirillum brasilense]UKJ75711.1 LysR family transcriptional regulator [Azospirillum brasilense]